MRHRHIIQALSLALFTLQPYVSYAQTSQVRGTWTLNREQSDNINDKIDLAVEPMNFVVRQFARPRLRGTNTAYPRVVITYDEQNIRVDRQDQPSVSSPANGHPVLWERETGETCLELHGDCVRVTHSLENGRLEQTYTAEDGKRINVFASSSDGNTLTMDVTLTSPRLAAPLVYRLVYNRANS